MIPPPPGTGIQRQLQVTPTAFTFAATIVLAVIPLGSPTVSAFADSPPKLNVGSSCDAAAKGAISTGRDKESCMGDELAAQEMLVKNWSQYTRAHKTQCVGMTTQGGPSYVELISCLDIMRDADAIRKADPFSGLTDRGPKRAPSNPPTRGGSKQ
jgi:hypothetical protein